MINLAVIEIKDVIKYLVRVTIVITVVVAITRYFLRFRTEIQNGAKIAKTSTFFRCLDTVIPSIKVTNNRNENSKNEKEPLKKTLEVELGMLDKIIYKGKEDDKKEENIVQSDINKEDDEGKIEEAKTGVKTQVQESNVPQKFTTTYNTVKIKNETKIKLTEEMLKPNVKISTKDILIYHTHTCESYTQSEKYTYKKSGNFRTTDTSRSVVRVGTELAKYMKNYGRNVIHDKTLYDYPSYNGSYDRSLSNVSKLLDKNPKVQVLFDIHRDAIRR